MPINNNPKLKTFKKVLMLNEISDVMVQDIMELKGSPSYSQVVREAIFEYHRSLKPAYLQPSVKMKEKEKEIEMRERIENMPDLEYCETVVKGVVIPAKDKTPMVVFHFYNNGIRAIPVDTAKKYFEDHPQDLELHLATLDETNLEDKLNSSYGKSTLLAFNIQLPNDKTYSQISPWTWSIRLEAERSTYPSRRGWLSSGRKIRIARYLWNITNLWKIPWH